jgi:flagellar protein FliS
MSGSYSAYQVAQAYRSASIAVSPLTGVVMLLDGAIVFLKKSIEASRVKRIEESHNHMVRATAILRGLQHHLNVEKGGAVADRLGRTYNSLILACLRSFGTPDAEPRYRRIIGSLMELREAWSVVAAASNVEARSLSQ